MMPDGAGGDRRTFRVALGVLGWNLAVVLWGALVRATGSGAGCGSHWPLCNGEVVPLAPTQSTVIEFTHRLLSVLALAAVVALWAGTLRRTARGNPARRWAWGSLVLIVAEALVGAGLVLMGWVGEDASAGRAASIAVHLILTYALLACLVMVAWNAAGRRRGPEAVPISPAVAAALVAGMLAVGMTGAVTALGDTLFPSQSLAEGLAEDLARGAHWLVRLRVIHPLLAVVVAIGTLAWSQRRRRSGVAPADSRRWLSALRWVLTLQLTAGLVNVALLAPIWMQIVHLFLADVAWMVLVVCLADGVATRNPDPSAPPK